MRIQLTDKGRAEADQAAALMRDGATLAQVAASLRVPEDALRVMLAARRGEAAK